jgi:SAM-dependent methyltransferase
VERNPNGHLISEASHLSPGAALDVGCGEGADAIWLAQRGWQVTAVDLSTVAIRRGATHAAQAGAEIADHIDWLHADRPPMPELFFTGDDIVALLDPSEWDVITNTAPQRSATDPDGRNITIHDTVFRARHRG